MRDFKAEYPSKIHSFSCDYSGVNEYEDHGCIFPFIEDMLKEIDRLRKIKEPTYVSGTW